MSKILDRPGKPTQSLTEVAPLKLPREFDGNEHGFPNNLFIFETEGGKHICVNAETPPPDPFLIEVLAAAANQLDGEEFLHEMGLDQGGVIITMKEVTFNEACKIAYSKPHVQAIGLQKGRQSVRLFHIR